MKSLDIAAAILLVLAGANWGLLATTGYEMVSSMFGPMSALSRLFYLIMGLAALYQALNWKTIQERWRGPATQPA